MPGDTPVTTHRIVTPPIVHASEPSRGYQPRQRRDPLSRVEVTVRMSPEALAVSHSVSCAAAKGEIRIP